MFDQITAKALEFIPTKLVLNVVISLVATLTILNWAGVGVLTISSPDLGDFRAASLSGTPLGVTYGLLGYLGVSREWIWDTHLYFATRPTLSILLIITSCLLCLITTLAMKDRAGFSTGLNFAWWLEALVLNQFSIATTYVPIVIVLLIGLIYRIKDNKWRTFEFLLTHLLVSSIFWIIAIWKFATGGDVEDDAGASSY